MKTSPLQFLLQINSFQPTVSVTLLPSYILRKCFGYNPKSQGEFHHPVFMGLRGLPQLGTLLYTKIKNPSLM